MRFSLARSNVAIATTFAVSLSLTNCGARVANNDVSSVDAIDAAPIADAPPSDAPAPDAPAMLNVSLRVELGPYVPPAAGAGFRVVASNRSGQIVERDTDATGRVQFQFDRSSVPWDVTVARTGYLVVSLLGISSDVDAAVHTDPLINARLAMQPHTLRLNARNVGANNVVSVFGYTLLGIEYAGGPMATIDLRYDVRPGIDMYRFWAIEWFSDGSGLPLRPLRAVELPSVPAARAMDLSFDVDMNTSMISPARTMLQVDMPTTGVVTRATLRRGYPSRVFYPFAYERGASRAGFPVGTGTAEFVRDAPGPLATFVHLGAALPPEGAALTYTTEPTGMPGPEVTFQPNSFGPNETLAVPAVEAIGSSGTSLDDASFEVSAPGYDSAGFIVYGADGQTVCWAGYQSEGTTVARRPLPALPNVIDRAGHFGGAMARVAASVERRHDRTVRPWATNGLRFVSVQVQNAPVPIRVSAR